MDDKDNIHEDEHLDDLAPSLSKLTKGEGFGVPGDYFDDLASRIQQRIQEEKELREIAPMLSEIPKYNPFAVPGDYFEELPSRIQERVIENRRSSWSEQLAWLFRPQFALAAVVIAIVAITVFLLVNNNGKENKMEVPIADNSTVHDSVSSDSLSVSEEEALYSMDESALVETLENEQATTNETTTANSDNEDDIVTYLVENDIDVASIVNEL